MKLLIISCLLFSCQNNVKFGNNIEIANINFMELIQNFNKVNSKNDIKIMSVSVWINESDTIVG